MNDINTKENSEIIGNCKLKEQIISEISNEVAHHAHIFTGAKGIGKASIAKQIAEHFLRNDQIHANLKIISEDNIEKQMISIEDFSGVKQFFALTSSSNVPRFLIIDGVENMSLSASNAILKLLEEPPKNCYIFLISHNFEKILPTIRSRALHRNLTPPSVQEIQQHLDLKFLTEIQQEKFFKIFNHSIGAIKCVVESEAHVQVFEIIDFFNEITKKTAASIYSFLDGILKKNSPISLKQIIAIAEFELAQLVKKHQTKEAFELHDRCSKILREMVQFNLDIKQNLFLFFNEIRKFKLKYEANDK